MELIGKWKVKKTMYPTSEGIKHLTKEELIALGVYDEEDFKMFDSVVEFKADGTVTTMIQIPANKIEEAKAEGASVDEDGFICVDSQEWKEEDGKAFYNLGDEFVPLLLNEEGLLAFAGGMICLEKVE